MSPIQNGLIILIKLIILLIGIAFLIGGGACVFFGATSISPSDWFSQNGEIMMLFGISIFAIMIGWVLIKIALNLFKNMDNKKPDNE